MSNSCASSEVVGFHVCYRVDRCYEESQQGGAIIVVDKSAATGTCQQYQGLEVWSIRLHMQLKLHGDWKVSVLRYCYCRGLMEI